MPSHILIQLVLINFKALDMFHKASDSPHKIESGRASLLEYRREVAFSELSQFTDYNMCRCIVLHYRDTQFLLRPKSLEKHTGYTSSVVQNVIEECRIL